MTDSAIIPEVHTACTSSGTAFAMLPLQAGPAPTLLLLAMAAQDTLRTDSYSRVGRLLRVRGWNVVSVDVPCHGADRRVDEPVGLDGWATRIGSGEDIVAPFRTRVNDVLAHLIDMKMADPLRIAAAGISRGGFMAFQAAAGNPRIGAVAALAPVTDLGALTEFKQSEAASAARQPSLADVVDMLADRAVWITIGSADERVDTANTIALSRKLVRATVRRGLPPQVTLHVLPTPGHQSFPDWHDRAAEWLASTYETRRS